MWEPRLRGKWSAVTDRHMVGLGWAGWWGSPSCGESEVLLETGNGWFRMSRMIWEPRLRGKWSAVTDGQWMRQMKGCFRQAMVGARWVGWCGSPGCLQPIHSLSSLERRLTSSNFIEGHSTIANTFLLQSFLRFIVLLPTYSLYRVSQKKNRTELLINVAIRLLQIIELCNDHCAY